MRKVLLILYLISILFSVTFVSAQEDKKNDTNSLVSKNLENESKSLDKQIKKFTDDIRGIVSEYKLSTIKDIYVLPYQTSYENSDNFIMLEKHSFIRDGANGEITGIRKKSMKLYVSGDSVSKIESTIYEKHYSSAKMIVVTIIDPSPGTEETSDITFSHNVNNKELLKEKKLGDIRNTTAFPIANSIKRDFYIPHLKYFYASILSVAETYYKSVKDADSTMSEFLKKAGKI